MTLVCLFTKKNHFDILGFQTNDFETRLGVSVVGGRAACDSSAEELKLSGTDVDRLSASSEWESSPTDKEEGFFSVIDDGSLVSTADVGEICSGR